jgi:L-lactate dehydrogenase (cytochrome)
VTHGPIPVTPDDYRRVARTRLPGFLFDYVDGGANDEQTMRLNLEDLARVRLRQRVLKNVENVDTATRVADQPCSMPLVLAPVGMAGMYARRGEVQAARAADEAGIPFTLSTLGICSIEEVQARSRAPVWFQLYMLRDREAVSRLLERSWLAGCRTLVFTVDLPVAGVRHRDYRHGLQSTGLGASLIRGRQVAMRPGWAWDVGLKGRPLGFANLSDRVPNPRDLNAFKRWLDSQFDPRVTWDDIAWVRDRWNGRLLLKGILEVEDGEAAARVGADGIVVSNHGGRQLDSVSSSVSRLPAMVHAVGSRVEILMDGGVRSGVDVFKAVALGAKAAMIGRPWIWALAAGGHSALRSSLETFVNEFRIAMALAGVTSVRDIDSSVLDRSGR